MIPMPVESVKLSENAWQSQVVKLARLAGWEHYHNLYAPGSDSGFLDLVLVHEKRGHLIFAELKRETAKCSHRQRWWANLLSKQHRVYVWRPSDIEGVAAALQSWAGDSAVAIARDFATRWLHDIGTRRGDLPLTPAEIAAGLHLQRRRRRA